MTCTNCGMDNCEAPKYHPYLACLAFRECKDGNKVEANLRAVVEYGMKAERAGISLKTAMSDISMVIRGLEGRKAP